MSDAELEAAIQTRIDEPTAAMTDGVTAAIALPGWLKLAIGFAVAKFGPMAPGAALSGLEAAGLEHQMVRDGAQEWLVRHP